MRTQSKADYQRTTYRRMASRLALNSAGLLALALVLLAGANQAAAGVRVKAKVHTPYGVVRIDNGRQVSYRTPRQVVRVQRNIRITKHDRKVAQRLARYTGVPQRVILNMRRDGYRWNEIGHQLDLPRYVTSAAQHKKSWKRFLRYGGDSRYCEIGQRDYDDRRGRRNHHDD